MKSAWLGAVSLVVFACPALAQPAPQSPTGNLERLGAFQVTGTVEPKPIPQEGRKADAIRRNLQRIKLPPGFKIDLYAIVPDARHMAVGPNAGVVFVGTRKNNVYAVTDRDKDRVADEVKVFAPSIEFKIPERRLLLARTASSIVVEQNRVLQFPAAEFFYEGPDVAAFEVVKQGELIPPDEESYNHTARVCRIGPDNKLYISLGQPFNVPPKDKLDLYKKRGIGGIIRMDQRRQEPRGLRARHPQFGRHRLQSQGQDAVVHRQPGRRHGRRHPARRAQPRHQGRARISASRSYGGGKIAHGRVQGRASRRRTPCSPQVEMAPHAADLGMTFYTGTMFPAQYRGGIFSAQHGSWNRTKPVGARMMFTPLKPDGTADKTAGLRRGLAHRERRIYRPPGRRRAAPRRLAARLRRHRRARSTASPTASRKALQSAGALRPERSRGLRRSGRVRKRTSAGLCGAVLGLGLALWTPAGAGRRQGRAPEGRRELPSLPRHGRAVEKPGSAEPRRPDRELSRQGAEGLSGRRAPQRRHDHRREGF